MLAIANNVEANEIDETIIETMNTEIVIYDKNAYEINEKYKTYTIFGTNPKEHYFYKLLNNRYEYEYNNKKKSYIVEHEIVNIESLKNFATNIRDNGYFLSFGETTKLLNESEEYIINYRAILDKKDNNFSYLINENRYETKKHILLLCSRS